MSIITNGMLTNNISDITKKIMAEAPELYVTLLVSIDEIGDNHDKIRGVKGIYKNVLETISKLGQIQTTYPNLAFGVASTYSSFNEHKIIDIYKYIKTNIRPDTFTCAFVRGNPKDKTIKTKNIENFVKLHKMFKMDLIYKKIKGVSDPIIGKLVAACKLESTVQLTRILKKNHYLFPCYAGKINVVIYPNGDVFPCELLNYRMGNLRKSRYDFRKIWFSKKSNQIREKIKKNKCYCVHGCYLLTNIIFNPRFLPKILKNYLRLIFKA